METAPQQQVGSHMPVREATVAAGTSAPSWTMFVACVAAAAAAGAAARPAIQAAVQGRAGDSDLALPLVKMPVDEFTQVRETPKPRAVIQMAEATEKDAAFGASHTSFYTDAVAKDSYETLDDVLDKKMADPELKSVLKTLFDGCGTITEALRKELVTVAENQASVFGDVQLGVDVLADNLMWVICKTEPLIKEGASEEEPEVREMHSDGKFCICWDPLDGSSIVDNNWAVGTIIGIR